MDRIFESWLEAQRSEWNALAGRTDRVQVAALGPESPARNFVAEFSSKGLVRLADGKISESESFAVGIHFSENHLRMVEPLGLVWLLSPPNAWHPNIRFPIVCPGHLRPGVSLVEILYQVHSIFTYQNFNLADNLNPEAAAWARERRSEFPVDSRPLKRREFDLHVEEVIQ